MNLLIIIINMYMYIYNVFVRKAAAQDFAMVKSIEGATSSILLHTYGYNGCYCICTNETKRWTMTNVATFSYPCGNGRKKTSIAMKSDKFSRKQYRFKESVTNSFMAMHRDTVTIIIFHSTNVKLLTKIGWLIHWYCYCFHLWPG